MGSFVLYYQLLVLPVVNKIGRDFELYNISNFLANITFTIIKLVLINFYINIL